MSPNPTRCRLPDPAAGAVAAAAPAPAPSSDGTGTIQRDSHACRSTSCLFASRVVIVCCCPSRLMISVAVRPAGVSRNIRRNWSSPSIACAVHLQNHIMLTQPHLARRPIVVHVDHLCSTRLLQLQHADLILRHIPYIDPEIPLRPRVRSHRRIPVLSASMPPSHAGATAAPAAA